MTEVEGDHDPSGPRDPSESPTIKIEIIRGISGMLHGSAHDHVVRTSRKAARIAIDKAAGEYQLQIADIISNKDRQIAAQSKTIHELEATITELQQRIITNNAVAEGEADGNA